MTLRCLKKPPAYVVAYPIPVATKDLARPTHISSKFSEGTMHRTKVVCQSKSFTASWQKHQNVDPAGWNASQKLPQLQSSALPQLPSYIAT